MPIIEIVLLGLALSMDAFAVTVSNLMAYPHLSRLRRFALPVIFGLFQGLMPLTGYLIGSMAASVIDTFAGPLALILLACIGGKMAFESIVKIREAQKSAQPAILGAVDASAPAPAPAAALAPEQTATGKPGAALTLPSLLLQAVATSIDALIVGISLLALGADIVLSASLIALTTFACCVVALTIGKRLGLLLGDKAQLIGGLVLIGIGIKACFF
jgi:putative Mn2+ efflux pump MntP